MQKITIQKVQAQRYLQMFFDGLYINHFRLL